jgi:hypothetical protein
VIDRWHHFKGADGGIQVWEGGSFQFVEPPHSLAARVGLDDDIGQISAFFYAATEMNWLRKLGATEDENKKLRVLYPTSLPGKAQLCCAYPLAYITIHYMHEDILLDRHNDGLLSAAEELDLIPLDDVPAPTEPPLKAMMTASARSSPASLEDYLGRSWATALRERSP